MDLLTTISKMLHRKNDSISDRYIQESFSAAEKVGITGKIISDQPDHAAKGIIAAKGLGQAYLDMKMKQENIPASFMPAKIWKELLDAEWTKPRNAAKNANWQEFDDFLRNFFRNSGLSGFWGGTEMYQSFLDVKSVADATRLNLFKQQYTVWLRECAGSSLKDLNQPRIGNPWGYNIEGNLIIEPAFEYHELASRFRNILNHSKNPIVMEIGGGFGGLARHLLMSNPQLKYVGFDLPENVVIQSWYLMSCFPDFKVVCNSYEEINSDARALLLPNWQIADISLERPDLLINVHSFGEMSYENIESYFHEIVRLQPEWFYHCNLNSPRNDGSSYLLASDYPRLKGYRMITSNESRWPRYSSYYDSPYPCREFLFQRI